MMSLDNLIVRKIYGTVIPLEESLCVVGAGTLIIIPMCVPDAFYRLRILGGRGDLGVITPVWGQGRSLWQIIV